MHTSLKKTCIIFCLKNIFLFPTSNNPTSSTILCSLYCQIKSYLGSECVSTTTTTTSTSTTTVTTTLAACPSQYLGDPENVLLCQLWIQLLDVQQQFNSSPAIPAEVTSISCPYRYVNILFSCIYSVHKR